MTRRLKKERTRAVMIDMQERLVPAMSDTKKLCERTRILLAGLHLLGVPITATQQYTKGLGSTLPDLMAAAGLAEFEEKITYSCLKEPIIRAKWEEDQNRNTFLLFGIEAHICVLQTALDLLDAGYNVFVVCDCIDSRHERDKKIALRRLAAEGAALTTVESCLFELLERAGTPMFKAISHLVK